MQKKKILTLLSGGIDSFVLLDFLKKNGFDPICIYVKYGQIAYKYEYCAFKSICKYESIKIKKRIMINNFGNNIQSGLTNINIISDYFPSRNLVLISLVSSFLANYNCNYIALGVINSTRFFPDCSRLFLEKLENVLTISLDREIKILTPLEDFLKIDIIKYARKYNLPISMSYSCQKGKKKHCGKCPSCLERFNALEKLKNNLEND